MTDRTRYLDHAATTPMRPGVAEAMAPYLGEVFGNPSGVHAVSRRAKNAVEEARERAAALLGTARPLDVVFTSGGTESDNLAVAGAALAPGSTGRVVVTAVEHEAVLASAGFLGRLGGRSTVVPVGPSGSVTTEDVLEVVGEDVVLVSVMAANNETGARQPVRKISEAVRSVARPALVHTDAVQAFCSDTVTVAETGADLITLAGHKIGGPKGVGLLVVPEGVELEPVVHGGGQELGLRSGTLNVAGIVGMVAAMESAADDRDRFDVDVGGARDGFERRLVELVPDVELTVAGQDRVPRDLAPARARAPGRHLAGPAGRGRGGGVGGLGLLVGRGPDIARPEIDGDGGRRGCRVRPIQLRMARPARRRTRRRRGARRGHRGAAMKVLVAMSGGVDSSVAAALLAEEGHDVIGVTLKQWEGASGEMPTAGCCTVGDAEDARRVAAQLDIPYYVLDYVEQFRTAVVEPFADAYARGETPNPCIECNRTVRFSALLDRTEALGCEVLATGHHARVERRGDRWALCTAVDPGKDQSYVLHMLGQAELARIRFPIGHLTKARVRAKAEALGLRTAFKPDSQDLCFIGTDGYRGFLRRRRPELARPGPVVDATGVTVGDHEGTIDFTIGQRRGIGVVTADGPRYVTAIDPGTATVRIGRRTDLEVDGCDVASVGFVAGLPPEDGVVLGVKVRYRARPVAATLRRDGAGWRVGFAEPQVGVAPGQAAVFYRGEEVVGGGRIVSTHRAALAAV